MQRMHFFPYHPEFIAQKLLGVMTSWIKIRKNRVGELPGEISFEDNLLSKGDNLQRCLWLLLFKQIILWLLILINCQKCLQLFFAWGACCHLTSFQHPPFIAWRLTKKWVNESITMVSVTLLTYFSCLNPLSIKQGPVRMDYWELVIFCGDHHHLKTWVEFWMVG